MQIFMMVLVAGKPQKKLPEKREHLCDLSEAYSRSGKRLSHNDRLS